MEYGSSFFALANVQEKKKRKQKYSKKKMIV